MVENLLDNIRQKIIAIMRQHIDDIENDTDLDKSFFELGLTSILAVDLVEAINDEMHIDLGIEVMFDYNDINELSEFIANEYAEILVDNNICECQNIPCTENQEKTSEDGSMPIAIVGVSGKFGEANNIEEFWKYIKEGKSCIKEIDRWPVDDFYDANIEAENKSISKWSGLLNNVDKFDALFFKISPLEAEKMDPQQRVFLEEAYKAFEDAGYTANNLSGLKTGVFVGARNSDYKDRTLEVEAANSQTFLGNDMAILAARISYFLNLKGPSLAIDTACSSSLVAVHLACESIRRGESDIALAGGVFIMNSPEFYKMASKVGMLSPTGACNTFDTTANGIVVGEGVGALILKPLQKACEDHDHIYGVIRGSAINQDGKTKGITAPSMISQKSLLCEAYKNANISPETVSYIEAHGTGTKLGDPIEVKALTNAFKTYTDKKQFCAIGSHKPNFGHTIMAAGLGGIFKILMAMKYKQIPPSINFNTLNEHIDIENSPFYITKQLRPWEKINDIPLRAGVSAFGFSGTNCHVIIEEAPSLAIKPKEVSQYLFLFSAQTKEVLEERLKETYDWLQINQDANVGDISYTLCMRRQVFPIRCIFIAKDINELTEMLHKIINHKQGAHYFTSEGNLSKSSQAYDSIKHQIQNIQSANNYDRCLLELAETVVNLDEFDLGFLYKDNVYYNVSLPVYPFNGEHYWIKSVTKSSDRVYSEVLHPLIHKNTSNLFKQKFTTCFTGKESFIKDHVVNEDALLPGVAYLEMVYTAVNLSCPNLKKDKLQVVLKDIVWMRLMKVQDTNLNVHIALTPKEDGMSFEIFSGLDEEGLERIVYCQGNIVLKKIVPENPIIIETLKTKCNNEQLDMQQCYAAFKNIGLKYGPFYRSIKAINIGKQEAIVELSLPDEYSEKANSFYLHPSVMDGMLQATLAVVMDLKNILNNKGNNNSPMLPFALEKLEIFSGTSSHMWAHITCEDNNLKSKAKSINIGLYDELGQLVIRISGFITKPLDLDKKVVDITPEGNTFKPMIGNVLMYPKWQNIINDEIITRIPIEQNVLVIGDNLNCEKVISKVYPSVHKVILSNDESIEGIYCKLEQYGEIDHIILITPNSDISVNQLSNIIQSHEQGVIRLFRLTKALIQLGYDTESLQFTILTSQMMNISENEQHIPTHAAIKGLIGSLSKEIPSWKIRCVDLEENFININENALKISDNLTGEVVAYRQGLWYKQKLLQVQPITLLKQQYRKNGVYVILGGAGGIGTLLSEYLIKYYQAQVIWIGRRPKNEVLLQNIKGLGQYGKEPYYIQGDANDEHFLKEAYTIIKQKYGVINGIIHSALVLHDQSIYNMDESIFREVLDVKINASVNLVETFKDECLDFIMFFSSINTFIKSPGQTNYAAGCAFKDSFATYLANQLDCKVKVINWGYWGQTGVVASEKYAEKMLQIGLGSIEESEAMHTLETLLETPVNQLIFMKTVQQVKWDCIDYDHFITLPSKQNLTKDSNQVMNSLIKVQLPDKYDLLSRNIINGVNELEEILCKLLCYILCKMQLLSNQDTCIPERQKQLKIPQAFTRWLNESLCILQQSQLIVCENGQYKVRTSSTFDEIENIWEVWQSKKANWLQSPDMSPKVILVEKMLQTLPQILKGEILATEVMFPEASVRLVENVYKNNVISDYFNEVLANALVNYITAYIQDNPSNKIRILEIGAGTGGTSAMVFSYLKEFASYIDEYCYTDLSKAFLNHAQDTYAQDNPFLTYKIFNAEIAANQQDLEIGAYDIVIATNVLHATKNINFVINNAKSLLKKGGLILLNEINSRTIFNHLTFGLLEGWWLYEDESLRIPGCPGVDPKMWCHILETNGFSSTAILGKQYETLGQQVILGISNGITYNELLIDQADKSISNIDENDEQTQTSNVTNQTANTLGEELLLEKLTSKLINIIGEVLHISVQKMNAFVNLEQYGMDSILVVQVTSKLKKYFKTINTTLLFECQTINEIALCLIEREKGAVQALVGINDLPPVQQNAIKATGAQKVEKVEKRFISLSETQTQQPNNINKQVVNGTLSQDIAVIGLAGRYAEAENINVFWENLKNGKNCITEIPKDRWQWCDYNDSTKEDYIYTKWGGFIKSYKQFDPLFFHISPAEAEKMDPQERLFLETAYESIEDAGYTSSTLSSTQRVGVFVGVMNGNYATGASYWSIANRVSYLLNFQGPSMAVDTACSSSLTSIHLALDSLNNNLCDCAIAGGVNLIVDPVHYKRLTAVKMLSHGNKCKAFGTEADGFVDGEGVGAILLKPLQKAIADGDHIYGVIKGSVINAGGKTNGYTVPNPKAQSKLVTEAFERCNISMRAVSYIEAHGTGTALGDPIEITGLTHAFETQTSDKQFCAIGSVKSNIGHCEGASGIASVTKVLLQMKYKQLVPSLNCEQLNTNIDFESTPFIVQRSLTNWQRPVVTIDGMQKEYPRIAGISSFGAGGANAHVVIEEYISEEQQKQQSTLKDTMIVLSAKNKVELAQSAQRLLDALEHSLESNIFLSNIAYTLQVGRQALNQRLGMIVSSIDELKEKLQLFIENSDNIPDLYEGNIRDYKDMTNIFEQDADFQKTIIEWVQKNKFRKVLELWVRGVAFDWNIIYSDYKPQRISLPTYPFAQEEYWINKKEQPIVNNCQMIHPLLQKNTSNILENKFTSIFNGEEDFLKDHILNETKVLSGAACLEMIYAAAYENMSVLLDDTNTQIILKDIKWLHPIYLKGKNIEVNIRFNYESNSEATFEIYTSNIQEIVCCQGKVALNQPTNEQHIDLLELQKSGSREDSNECYKHFASMGLKYGSSYQGINKIYRGEDFILTKLDTPAISAQDAYTIIPGMLDSALQTSLLFSEIAELNRIYVPSSLKDIEIIHECTQSMWAVVMPSEKITLDNPKFDITLCDESGRVCIKMHEISAKPFGVNKIEHIQENLMLYPTWQKQDINNLSELVQYDEKIVAFCNISEDKFNAIKAYLSDEHCLLMTSEGTATQQYELCALELFRLIKTQIQNQSVNKRMIQLVISNQEAQNLLVGLEGLLKTAAIEDYKTHYQVLLMDLDMDITTIAEQIRLNRLDVFNQKIKYVGHQRYVFKWKELTEKHMTSSSNIWQEQGVYLITGGAGGIGLRCVEKMVHSVNNINIILVGRSILTKEKQDQINKLCRPGVYIDYQQVDLTKVNQVEELISYIQEKFNKLNGILHAAGVHIDHRIVDKSEAELLDVFSPKINATVNLDEATKTLNLDFFVLFSSIASTLGNMGQADYAAANAFMDQYAAYRNQLIQENKRSGHTISINWPLWQDGGMQVSQQLKTFYAQNMGMLEMSSQTAMHVFEKCLAAQQDEILVLVGNVDKLKEKILQDVDRPQTIAISHTQQVLDSTTISEQVQKLLTQEVVSQLKIKETDIESDILFDEYGFDSISYTELANRLNRIFDLDLNPTVFYQVNTIEQVTKYLVTTYSTELTKQLSTQCKSLNNNYESPKSVITQKVQQEPKKEIRRSNYISKSISNDMITETMVVDEPIAIVGMSGAFPQAHNLEEYWDNLVNGKSCISEIPLSRWDWKKYYGDPKSEPNKTNIKWGGFIDNIDEFDAAFFNISPKEAELMDPQQRLLMTYCWKAIEDAGYSARSLSGSDLGIFVGTGVTGYHAIKKPDMVLDAYYSTGSLPSVGPNRMSYFLNVHGPSEAIETACSSSLVAVHRAVQAIRNNECSMALVGGCNTLLNPDLHISFSKAGMLAEDGKCKTFSDKANGYVRGEGVGMIFLKKLKDAENAGDHIYGVIRATTENHGGHVTSLTAPNPLAQAELIKNAYLKANIDPRTVTYIEAHGTGTKLGDPIEINGLKEAFKSLYLARGIKTDYEHHCGIGSVKTNIGHLELAAGIAGLIKVLLQMQHKTLVKTLNCETINPYINLEDSPFYIVRETSKWSQLTDQHGKIIPRRAGVSAFGFGGVNAHVVIEEYISEEK